VVVEVHGQRQHVNGQHVGEGRLVVGVAGALVDALLGGFPFESLVVLGAAAGLPGVLAGFAADLGFGLDRKSTRLNTSHR
jgi:hypothetical protein